MQADSSLEPWSGDSELAADQSPLEEDNQNYDEEELDKHKDDQNNDENENENDEGR